MMNRIDEIKARLVHFKKCNPTTEQFYIKDVEHLLTELDRLTEAQRWIPVTERLPEVGRCVLVRQTYHAFIGDHGEYEGITVGYLHQPTDKRRMPYFYYAAVSDYGDMVRAESICPGQEFVTHWMPLPAPPEEGAENERD